MGLGLLLIGLGFLVQLLLFPYSGSIDGPPYIRIVDIELIKPTTIAELVS